MLYDKEVLKYLRRIADRLCAMTSSNGTSAGINTSISSGFKSVSIVKTNGTGTVVITLSDLSTYTLVDFGETFSDAASPGGSLPAYTISSSDGGTWKWHGIN